MAAPVLLPRLGMSMKTALFAEWYEPDGATVRQGEPVCRIECDYVAMDIEAEADGILRHRVKPGLDFPAGEVVGLILGAGERMPAAREIGSVGAPAATETPPAVPVAPPVVEPSQPAPVEASPSLHDRDIYEPVLLFPQRMTEPPSPSPAEALPAATEPDPPGPEPEADEAERNNAWERMPGDEDFQAAWHRAQGLVTLPPDFMAAPRRILPLGPTQPEAPERKEPREPREPVEAAMAAQPEPEVPNEPEEPSPTTEHESEAVTEPPAVAVQEPDAKDDPQGRDVTREAEAMPEPEEQPVTTEYRQEAVKAPEEPPEIAEHEPEATSKQAGTDVAAAPEPVTEATRAAPTSSADVQPEPEPATSTERPPERRTGAATTTILNLRATVHMDEALKMREQLAREWGGSGVRPTNEDVVLRAVARGVAETRASRRRDDHVGLRVLKGVEQPAVVYVVAGGPSCPFREAVSELAALVEEGGPGTDAACTVTSLEAFGIDESLPELGRDQVLAFSMGAVRPVPVVEGERLGRTSVLTLTLAYDPGVVPEAAAAHLLARVRDLVEAPYALLVA